MDIMELGAIGELVGGVAVIATLAYLAVQVRHAKTELQMVRFEKVMEDYNDFNRQLATQEIATIWAKATTEYRSLQDHERIQFHALATQLIPTYEQSRTSWADGIFPDNQFESQENWVVSFLRTPGAADWWEVARRDWIQGTAERLSGRIDAEDQQWPAGHPLKPVSTRGEAGL